MGLYEGLRTVAGAGGTGAIDWDAAVDAAKAATDPGDVSLSAAEKAAYADDVVAARDALRMATNTDFDVPDTIQVQSRHHWIDANAATFRRVLAPLDERPSRFPNAMRRVNTGTMAASLGYLARNVLGQYDPLLLSEGGDGRDLYFVHPNIESAAANLDVDGDRFRRWIAFHEVAHVAEFEMAPWLSNYLAERMQAGLDDLGTGELDFESGPLGELDAAMTVVEGYAELLMDRAFDDEAADLRAKLDERREGGGPLTRLFRRALGIGLKRRQYERGRAFFDAVVDDGGMAAARTVWESPETVPTSAELDEPARWLARVQNRT
ncbi:MAG: zinc-dependent metalloprotease [Halobacteriaceae archaeon]